MVAIGRDLGTTNSCVGVWRNGRVEIIANDLGARTTPSYVAFNETQSFIGTPAVNQIIKNPTNTVYEVKRLMGSRFEDPEVQKDMKRWPFTVVDLGGKPMIQVEYKKETKTFAPEQISAMVLQEMKEIADKLLDCDVQDAVITVPAYFNNAQRQATIDAAKIAGLNVLRIINEPTAAALAYGISVKSVKNRTILIYDLGGGTFDVSVVKVKDENTFDVLATSGDTHLGGGDIDNLLVQHIKADFLQTEGKDISNNARAIPRLRREVEKTKHQLSASFKEEVYIDALMEGADLSSIITRACFENLCRDLLRSTLVHVKDCLKQAKLQKDDIDEVVLVGGSTRIPLVQKLLGEFFAGKYLKQTINPDEAVAHGAALLAAQLSKVITFKDLVFSDITPLTLGIEVVSLNMSVLIPRGTRIPCKVTKLRHTTTNNQTEIRISVFEGERSTATENHLLGSFLLKGIPPAPAREGKMDLTFDLNENGILKVTAVEKTTGKSNSIVIRMDDQVSSAAWK